MRDYAECKPLLDHIAAEHRQLQHALQDIDKWLRDHWKASDTTVVRKRLGELRGQLERHFAEEDNDGCLEEARCRVPALSPQVTELQLEHPQLLKIVDEVIRRLDVGAPAVNQEIGQAFSRFIQRMEGHEAAETSILRQAFGTDDGYEGED